MTWGLPGDTVDSRQGFPRQYRLLGGRDFERVMRKGRKAWTRNLIVFVAPGGTEVPRLGLAVGRKVGKAVCRNRWRRLVREAFRTGLRPRLPAIDVVVAVKAAEGAGRDEGRQAAGRGAHSRCAGTGTRRAPPGLAAVERELLDAIRRVGALGGEG
ncbi:MAG: ribonuclease P protein component [Deltaproteobacteria bacterium]|nr:ribonuclease P protein component [Deltaproteobacteria bacterium]